MTSITFKLSNEMKESLEEEAKKDGRTVSDFLRRHFQGKLKPASNQKKGGRK